MYKRFNTAIRWIYPVKPLVKPLGEKMATLVRVSWKAFSDPRRAEANLKVFPVTSAAVQIPEFNNLKDSEILNKVYQDTNLYNGEFWNYLEDVLPKDRSHTALSIGDEVTISRSNQSRVYRCAETGWDCVEGTGWELTQEYGY